MRTTLVSLAALSGCANPSLSPPAHETDAKDVACAVSLVTPAADAALSASPDLSWTGDCTGYLVEIAPTADFAMGQTIAFGAFSRTDLRLPGPRWDAVTGMLPGEGYWRVVGGSGTAETTSEARRFVPATTGTTPALTQSTCSVSLASPSDGALLDPSTAPTFEWSGDCEGNRLQLSTSPSFELESTLNFGQLHRSSLTLTERIWTAHASRFETEGYWRVVGGAVDADSISTVRAFTTAPVDTGTPTGDDTGTPTGGDDPVRVSDDGHWFTFRGRTVPLVGDSITQGWMETGTDFDHEAYLDTMAAKGANALLLWAYIGIEDQLGDSRIGYNAPELFPWVGSVDTSFDLTQQNDAYFDRLSELVALANARDIVVVVQVHDGGPKWRFGGHPFNSSLGGPLSGDQDYVQLHSYGTEMGEVHDGSWSWRQKNQYYQERYVDRMITDLAGYPNVIYEMFNEPGWYSDSGAAQSHHDHFLAFHKARTDQVTMVNDDWNSFRGAANTDSISSHYPNWNSGSSASEFHGSYSGGYSNTPTMPYTFTEPVPSYTGDEGDHDAVRRMIWGTVLGGGSLFVLQNDASFGFAPDAGMASYATNRDIVLGYEGAAARLFVEAGIDVGPMQPDDGLASSGVALAEPGGTAVVFAEETGSFQLTLSAGSYTGTWYDPEDGSWGASLALSGGTQTVSTPSMRDWVLLVEN